VLDQGERVYRLPPRVKVEHRLVDAAVALAVEVLGPEALVDDQRGQRGVGQQDRAEHGLLGLEVLRRRDRTAAVEAGPVPVASVRCAHAAASLGRPPDEHMFVPARSGDSWRSR
jgi:hypothetical protein